MEPTRGMREHWLTCHKISLTAGFAALVLPETSKEPAPRKKLPSTQKGDRGRARTVARVARSARVADGELENALLDTLDDELDS